MFSARLTAVFAMALLVACAGNSDRGDTLAKLRNVKPDVSEVTVEDGLDSAMQSYRRFLEET
ncbi:MAG TPA: hypothetical protein VLD39_15620, partial [Gammaproteobacteria bacterium]|nr:hypothetical protein [Gammaproteobacteria bacterium]